MPNHYKNKDYYQSLVKKRNPKRVVNIKDEPLINIKEIMKYFEKNPKGNILDKKLWKSILGSIYFYKMKSKGANLKKVYDINLYYTLYYFLIFNSLFSKAMWNMNKKIIIVDKVMKIEKKISTKGVIEEIKLVYVEKSGFDINYREFKKRDFETNAYGGMIKDTRNMEECSHILHMFFYDVIKNINTIGAGKNVYKKLELSKGTVSLKEKLTDLAYKDCSSFNDDVQTNGVANAFAVCNITDDFVFTPKTQSKNQKNNKKKFKKNAPNKNSKLTDKAPRKHWLLVTGFTTKNGETKVPFELFSDKKVIDINSIESIVAIDIGASVPNDCISVKEPEGKKIDIKPIVRLIPIEKFIKYYCFKKGADVFLKNSFSIK